MFSSLKKMFGGKEEEKTVLAPAAGKAVSLKEVNDPTFSQEILGKALPLSRLREKSWLRQTEPSACSLRQSTQSAFPLRTALRSSSCSLDTVNLKGEHFTAHKQQGDKVKAGELLLEFDMEAIKAAGYDVITPVIICNTPNFPDMVCHTGQDVKELDTIIEL